MWIKISLAILRKKSVIRIKAKDDIRKNKASSKSPNEAATQVNARNENIVKFCKKQ